MEKKGIIAEFEKHSATILMYPFRTDIWRENAVHMQKYVLNLAQVISKYETVILVCRDKDLDQLSCIAQENIHLVAMEYDDIWARDIGPTFIRKGRNVEAINWRFNSWGGLKEGSYYPWDKDDSFSIKMAEYLGVKCTNADIVLEGGAITTDGEGTLFTTRSVLLNRNRNPFKSKIYVEEVLKEKLILKNVVWLKQGLCFDETNGHIDNVMSVVRPHEVCIAWTDDKKDPNYKRVRKILQDIQESYECRVHKIPLPSQLFMTDEEAKGLNYNSNALERKAGDLLPASYLNYYLVNEAVIIPSFGCEEDNVVYQIMQSVFPNRIIEQVFSREPLLGGGGIHCIAHEVPILR